MTIINKKYQLTDQNTIKHYEESTWTHANKHKPLYTDETTSKKYTLIKMEKLSPSSHLDRFIAILMAAATLGFGLLNKSFKKKVNELWKGKKVCYFALDANAPSPLENRQRNSTQTQQKNDTAAATSREKINKEETRIKPLHSLPIPPKGVIKNGYGEYLVYRIRDEGKKIAVSEKEYKEIFDVIENTRAKVLKDRHAYLEGKIQEKLGKEVRLAFVPRTLYEQIFLHECIQEEMNKQMNLHAKEVGAHMVLQPTLEEEKPSKEDESIIGSRLSSKDRKTYIQQSMKKAFWQLCIYDDQDYEQGFKKRHEDDYRQEHLVKVAAKLNEVALGKFKGKEEGFTFAEIVDVHNQEIDFFRSLKDPESENYKKAYVGFHTHVGLTRRFRDEEHPIRCHELYPLGIEKETDRGKQIVQKAAQLECTAEAVNHFLLYRGANFDKDEVTRKDYENVLANSLSYGTSLYGGALYDGGATPFHFMRKKMTDAQAFMIPFEKQCRGKTPFHAYFVHPVVSLGSSGEFFHARTKIWKFPEQEEVYGILGSGKYKFSQVKECCKTSQAKEKVESSFAKYKSKAYILAPRKQATLTS